MKTIAKIILLFVFVSGVKAQWVEYDLPGQYGNSNDICNVSETVVYSAGHDIHKSTNGGLNWVKQTNLPYEKERSEIDFINASTGWSPGADGSLLKTTNGGNNWIESFAGFETLTGVDFLNANTGYLTTTTGKVLKTTNGGSNWNMFDPPSFSYLTSVMFLNDQTGWISGSLGNTDGKIAKTTNGGQNWIVQLSNIFNAPYQVYFRNSLTGFASCYKKIYRTTNGGEDWDTATVHTEIREVKCITFVSASIGFAAASVSSNSGGILKTFDGGLNWYLQWTKGTNSCNSVDFYDSEKGWAGINSGVIVTGNSGGNIIGIEAIQGNIPGEFSLSQNYPNPFNPMTNIELRISGSGFVSLKVYDITGREVAILVYRELSAGVYNVDFDASHLSSGMYFYRMETAGFRDVKKMMLIK
jgi:photosystem II stability/assembly factor-like uncharacterized protein